MTERLNKRQHAKALTRKKVIDGARACWAKPGSYVERTPGGAGIREIATPAISLKLGPRCSAATSSALMSAA